MEMFEFIECSTRTHSLVELFKLMIDAASDEGFEYLAFVALNYLPLVRLQGVVPPAVAIHCPGCWYRQYVEQEYHKFDPVIAYGLTAADPFEWARLREQCNLDVKQQLVLEEARKAGLKNGVSVPLQGPWGQISLMSFASELNENNLSPKLGRLKVLASHFHVAFIEICLPKQNDSPNAQLSAREKECLEWVARGKSTWDISAILTISERTVKFHIKNAMLKLGTSSRIVAVVRAIRLNLIAMPPL